MSLEMVDRNLLALSAALLFLSLISFLSYFYQTRKNRFAVTRRKKSWVKSKKTHDNVSVTHMSIGNTTEQLATILPSKNIWGNTPISQFNLVTQTVKLNHHTPEHHISQTTECFFTADNPMKTAQWKNITLPEFPIINDSAMDISEYNKMPFKWSINWSNEVYFPVTNLSLNNPVVQYSLSQSTVESEHQENLLQTKDKLSCKVHLRHGERTVV
ncbi:hypothetical protein D3C79_128580 [compost metagenome]